MVVDVVYPAGEGSIHLRVKQPNGMYGVTANLFMDGVKVRFVGHVEMDDPAFCLEKMRETLEAQFPHSMHREPLLLVWDIMNVWATNG